MKRLMFIFLVFPSFAATCPTGFIAVEYDGFMPATSGACPAGYVAHSVDIVCGGGDGACWLVRMMCTAGISSLNVSGGLRFQLYSERGTTPALCVKYNDMTCYADLERGNTTDAINVNYNGVVYHTVK